MYFFAKLQEKKFPSAKHKIIFKNLFLFFFKENYLSVIGAEILFGLKGYFEQTPSLLRLLSIHN